MAMRAGEEQWFPGWLRATRAELELSQEGAARLIGVSVKTYQRWETGRNGPNEKQLAAVIWEFGIPPFPTKGNGMGYFLYPPLDLGRENLTPPTTATERPKLRRTA